MSSKESSFEIEGQTRHIDALIQSNKVLQYDLSLAKTALAETMKMFNNQSSDSGLRDHFAGLAMQGMVASSNNMDDIARSAYDMADAMIAERNKYKERHETFGEEL